MATLKDIRRRIRSVRNMQQITRAMKMVAASRLRRAQEELERIRPFANELLALATRIAAHVPADSQPLLRHTEGRRVLLVVVSGDRGLCGAFNANVIRYTERRLEGLQAAGATADLVTIGQRGYDWFHRRGFEPTGNHKGLVSSPAFAEAAAVADGIVQGFLTDRFDRVDVVHQVFRGYDQAQLLALASTNASAHKGRMGTGRTSQPMRPQQQARTRAGEAGGTGSSAVHCTPLLPIVSPEMEEARARTTDYLFEPGAADVLRSLLPGHVRNHLYHLILESVTAEQSARMAAMENATKNAGEMIDRLTLDYNKARQATITRELIEIVSGAEALAS